MKAEDWIKVEDKLPEEGDYVLIYYKPNITGIGCYYKLGGWFSDYDEEMAVPDYWMQIVPPKDNEL